jgi:hypothetical protein
LLLLAAIVSVRYVVRIKHGVVSSTCLGSGTLLA